MDTHFMLACCVAAALLVVSHLWFYLRVLRPVSRLAQKARALEQGDLAALETHCGGIAEVKNLRLAMASMARHVQRAQAQQSAYVERMADSREDERKRIAHELHDTTVQSLIAVGQAIDLARTWLKTDSARAEEMLVMAREQAVEAAADLRDRIADLRPPALEELGLAPALGLLVEKSGQSRAHLTISGTPRRLSEAIELAAYRATQEAVSNAIRHGDARRIDVTLAYAADALELTVKDDGHGFAPPSDLNDFALQGHYGLMGIRERIQTLGGTVNLTSRAGQGTTLKLRLPVAPAPYNSARDPVCGTIIEPGRAYKQSTYKGRVYTFCCPVCQGAFEASPERYV